MKIAIDIAKNIVLPQLEKDNLYDNQKNTAAFWEDFTRLFLDFENDAKPVYTLIYSLELADSEKIIGKLPVFYISFSNELAEHYVLNQHSKATDYLIETNNQTFLEQVQFYKTLQQVVKKVERKRIKDDLPEYYERLTFELSDTDIANATKKKGRDDLKAKFKEWDTELEHQKEPGVFYSLASENKSEPKSKVISLSWIKYAVAACVVVASGLIYFKFSNHNRDQFIEPSDTNVVTTTPKDTASSVKVTPVEAIAYTTTVSEKIVQYPTDFGFTNTTNSKVISIILKDASQNIAKLESKLATELDETAAGDGPKHKALKKQLDLLVSQQGTYAFDGKQLIIYTNDLKLSCSVLSLDDKVYYLKMDNQYYHLYYTKPPLKFIPLKEVALIEQLEKTSFENEE